ncbi:MAG: hypothetical protein ACLPKE_11065 [Streptosporangiaceae bacterium]
MAGPVRGVAGAAEASGPDVTGRAGALTSRPARRRRWAWVAGFTAAGIALFAAYIRLSATYPVNSDGANIVLMSWDMLHGNLLLHNWWMSDVSFYTTELPEYVLIDAIRGLSPDVTHIAAALTYTLAVVLAALLAKGRAGSREGLARVLLSAGIMLAPQLGVGIFVLLLSVGHIGTAVPALAVWLLLDLGPRRWYIPVIAGVMLAWAMIADSLVLVVAIAPLVIVSVSRAVPLLATGRPGPGRGTALRLRSAWYELSLAAAAAAAWVASWLAGKAIHALGGYTLHAVPFRLVAPAQLGVHAATTGDSLLALFGANFGGLHSGVAVAFAVLHLAGLALVAWALARVVRRWAAAGLVDQLLAVAIVINLAVYLFGSFSSGVLNGREIALVLPFGAALAGRSLGPVLAQARPAPRAARLTLVLLAVLAGYLACLGYELAQPVSPPANARLASWLQDHHLDHGLSGYWQASVVTIDSGGQVTIRAVTELGGGIVPYRWEAKSTWYSPARQYANFVVLQNQPGFFNYWYPPSQVGATFGAPARTYQLGPYTVLVWTHNLMPALHRWAVRTGTAATS